MKIAIALAYAIFLLWRGFGQRRAGFATWHMFAGANTCQMELTCRSADSNVSDFNSWDYLPHSMTTMDETRLRQFLIYLNYVQEIHVDGTVHIRDGLRARTIHIVGGYVVD
jgi:hypothetical protein